MKGKGMIVLVLGVFFMFGLFGCGAELLVTGIGAGSAAWTATSINKAIRRADYQGIIETDLNQAWTAAIATTQKMGIAVSEKNLDKDKGEGIITGQTAKHKKIQILLSATTPTITNIGIKARKGIRNIDFHFAILIFRNMIEEQKRIASAARAS